MSRFPYRNCLILSIILALSVTTLANNQRVNCPEGTIQFGSQCKKITSIEGCAIYKQNGECDICEYGYQKTNGKCHYTPTQSTACCAKFSNDGSCQSCVPGLYLEGNACLASVLPGCLQKKNGVCVNCDSNFYNKNGICHRIIPGCITYTNEGFCSECASGYTQDGGICIYINDLIAPKGKNCQQTNQYGCIKCENGYYLTLTDECKAFETGCLKYRRQKCIACHHRFNLLEGKCAIEGCESYNQNRNGCSKCVPPYQLDDGSCSLPNCLVAYSGKCRICQGNYRLKDGVCVAPIQDKCRVCDKGFFLGKDGQCHFSIVGCLQYQGNGCKVCKNSFYNIQGRCLIYGCDEKSVTEQGCSKCVAPFKKATNGACEIDNCEIVNANGCGKCRSGFHLQNGQCDKNDKNCKKYLSSSVNTERCAQCQNSFVLNRNYQCEPTKPGCVYQNGRCFSCYYPFIRDPKNQENCVIQGCQNYDLKGCIKCRYPYINKDDICVIENCAKIQQSTKECLECQPGFHLATQFGECVKDEPSCDRYCKEDGVCIKCSVGFYLTKDKKCLRSLENCVEMETNGKCLKCQQGYKVIDGVCQLIDFFCTEFIPGKGCGLCKEGYHLEAFKCIRNDPFCSSYSRPSDTQFCLACTQKYTLSSNLQCVREQPGCVYQKGVCIQCRKPFTFDKKKKQCFIEGCEKYNNDGCQQCRSPFEISGDICKIAFCKKVWNGKCEQCQQGYSQVDGGCVRRDPKCVEYNKKGECVKCIKDYVNFQGACIKQDKYCVSYSKHGGCNKCEDKYFVNADKVCQLKEPGCVYQKGECAYCEPPFQMHPIAKKCRINGCLEVTSKGCVNCKHPFETSKNSGQCEIPNCFKEKDGACVRCAPGYHLREGLFCKIDDPSCFKYNSDGDCQLCADGYMIMSSGQCQKAEDTCITKTKDGLKCLVCKEGYFVNYYHQCQRVDDKCIQYNNGVCSKCDQRHFLYDFICFPYSPGCVKYHGKNCIECKKSWQLVNGECFNYNRPKLHLEGQDDKYDFQITPVDITKSKYYIDNLSPASAIGTSFYSTVYGAEYSVCSLTSDTGVTSKGWKSQNPKGGQYIGFELNNKEQPVTFYAVQLEQVEDSYVTQFYIEYSVDGKQFIRVQKSFKTTPKITSGIDTIYFTGLYARSIRIVVTGFKGWPAARLQFFYYDTIRFRKISNLKSLTYLRQAIYSNFVDRMDNQMYINQRYFFQPNTTCTTNDVCFTGLVLCQPRKIDQVIVTCGQNKQNFVRQFYFMYSLDGKAFHCYQKCRKFQSNDQLYAKVALEDLIAKNVRVYPTDWIGKPEFYVAYQYK